jgi:hypothetical protein
VLNRSRDRTQSIITRAKVHQLSIRSGLWFSFDEMDQIFVTPEAGFRAGFGDDLVQPDPAGFRVLSVRYGQPPECPVLARLA